MTEDDLEKKAELRKIRTQGFMLRLAKDPNFRAENPDLKIPTRILLVGTYYVICSRIKDGEFKLKMGLGASTVTVMRETTSKIWITHRGAPVDLSDLLESGPEELKELIIYNMGLFK